MAELISDSPTKHRIVFNAPATFKTHLTALYEKEKDNLMIIDKYIADFNAKTGDLISDNNYAIIDDKNVEVAVLCKHLFRALGTTRKYAKCSVSITSETCIRAEMDPNINLKLKNQGTSDPLPVKYIEVSYAEQGDNLVVTIAFETEDDVTTYKCFPMIMIMVKDGILEALTSLPVSSP